jgi:sugar lactone lactonase YvrE
MRDRISLVVAALLLVACASAAPTGPAHLAPHWRAEGFAEPESVAMSADGRTLYVSNVAGEPAAKDGVGFISRVSPQGAMIEREWIKGLNAPKGMAVASGRLYVSDIDALVVVDVARSAVVSRIAVDGARFLNDVVMAPDGAVLISDSGGAKIYAVKDGAVSVWLADPLLAAVNGLTMEGGALLVSTMQGRLLKVDLATRAITQLAEGLGDGDGVSPLGAGHYLFSEWPGRIFHVTPDGAHTVLLDTREAKTLQNDFLLVGDTLYVANMLPGAVTAWKVQR